METKAEETSNRGAHSQSSSTAVFEEIQRLVKATTNGQLDERARVEQFDGQDKVMLQGINDLIDAFAAPFNLMAEYVDRVSKGDIPEKITDDYKGDFNEVKNNLNALIVALNDLIEGAATMAKAAKEGQLDTRLEDSGFQGVWKTIVQGLNNTLEGVAEPLNEVAKVLAAMAQKDCTRRVTGDYKGQYKHLKDNINDTAAAIDEAMTQVAQAVEQVAAAAAQVSAASQSLAEGATEQAAGLEETSSSLEEMASMTKQNADNAQQANTLSDEGKKFADDGTEAMNKMTQAINDIQKSSDETAKIIKVIDEIAFQTNLLALNAAVEAARAGEAGKGFAVVAEEVRNLAMRSAEAAKNTANMIEESVKNSKNGVDIAVEVGKALEEIVTSISKTSELVSEIAAASQEQAQGIDQVNTAVAQMDKVTQQNAANAEESASASEELSAQADALGAMVQEFVLSTSGGSVAGKQRGGHATTRAAGKPRKLAGKHHNFGSSDQAWHQIAGGSGKAAQRSQKKTVPSAERAIPLDESTDGLEEFNA